MHANPTSVPICYIQTDSAYAEKTQKADVLLQVTGLHCREPFIERIFNATEPEVVICLEIVKY